MVNDNNIPHVIHYCWFGGKPLPKSAQKCIASWQKFFPEYEIRRWDETNFDIQMMAYTREAYSVGKFAYVSDVARFWVLYHYGGLYFDTDVEVIRPMEDLVSRGAFMGIEVPSHRVGEGIESQMLPPAVNPGLGLCSEAWNMVYGEILQYYQSLHYINPDNNKPYPGTVVTHNTKILLRHGLQATNQVQQVAGIWIYPMDYFNPLVDATGELNITDNTRSIHWYSKTWCDKPMWYFRLTRILHRVQFFLGKKFK